MGESRFGAWVAQLVERVLGKDEVTGSIPVPGSTSYAVRMSGGNSGVESLPSKQMVAGSNPVPRSIVTLAAQAASNRKAQDNIHTKRGAGRTALTRG